MQYSYLAALIVLVMPVLGAGESKFCQWLTFNRLVIAIGI